jgi:hypothetical protein
MYNQQPSYPHVFFIHTTYPLIFELPNSAPQKELLYLSVTIPLITNGYRTGTVATKNNVTAGTLATGTSIYRGGCLDSKIST